LASFAFFSASSIFLAAAFWISAAASETTSSFSFSFSFSFSIHC